MQAQAAALDPREDPHGNYFEIDPAEVEAMESAEVSRVINAPLDEVFAHFVDPTEELRLGLHEEHVKAYRELDRTEDSLAYEFVFQSYGFRFGGAAREVFERNKRTRIFVTKGPLEDAIIDLEFEPTEDGKTLVRQITRVSERARGPLQKIFGEKMKAKMLALAGVHLDQHGRDIEGLPRKSYITQGEARAMAVMEFFRSVRVISLPMILMPLLAGIAMAGMHGTVSGWRAAVTLLGGALALFAGNLANDIWDFDGGADHAAIGTEGATLTGSGALIFGTFTPKQAWGVTALLLLGAAGCGAALMFIGEPHPWVPYFAVIGLVAALLYQAPPFKLSYRGYGLGELCIWAAFGPVPVAGAYYVQTGELTPEVGILGSIVGIGAALVLYCHHFLQWEADREAGKMGPIATLGPQRGAQVGIVLALGFAVLLGLTPELLGAPWWARVSGLIPVFLIPRLSRIAYEGNAAISWGLLQRAGEVFSGGLMVLSIILWAS